MGDPVSIPSGDMRNGGISPSKSWWRLACIDAAQDQGLCPDPQRKSKVGVEVHEGCPCLSTKQDSPLSACQPVQRQVRTREALLARRAQRQPQGDSAAPLVMLCACVGMAGPLTAVSFLFEIC